MKKNVKIVTLVALLGVFVASSRIGGSKHYFSDTFFGASIGLLTAHFVMYLNKTSLKKIND